MPVDFGQLFPSPHSKASLMPLNHKLENWSVVYLRFLDRFHQEGATCIPFFLDELDVAARMVKHCVGPWEFCRSQLDLTNTKSRDTIHVVSLKKPIDLVAELSRVKDHARTSRALRLLKRAQQGVARPKRAVRKPTMKISRARPVLAAPVVRDKSEDEEEFEAMLLQIATL